METTEKIVEAYARCVRNCATIPNIRCKGSQREIDLLAIDPLGGHRYHVETSISTSNAFSRLTAKPFDPISLKVRVKKATMRRTVGYFIDKFSHPAVIERLRDFGFEPGSRCNVGLDRGSEARGG